MVDGFGCTVGAFAGFVATGLTGRPLWADCFEAAAGLVEMGLGTATGESCRAVVPVCGLLSVLSGGLASTFGA